MRLLGYLRVCQPVCVRKCRPADVPTRCPRACAPQALSPASRPTIEVDDEIMTHAGPRRNLHGPYGHPHPCSPSRPICLRTLPMAPTTPHTDHPLLSNRLLVSYDVSETPPPPDQHLCRPNLQTSRLFWLPECTNGTSKLVAPTSHLPTRPAAFLANSDATTP